MSPQRVLEISYNDFDFKIKLKGKPGEEVKFAYVYEDQMVDMMCVMSKAGTAVLRIGQHEFCEGV